MIPFLLDMMLAAPSSLLLQNKGVSLRTTTAAFSSSECDLVPLHACCLFRDPTHQQYIPPVLPFTDGQCISPGIPGFFIQQRCLVTHLRSTHSVLYSQAGGYFKGKYKKSNPCLCMLPMSIPSETALNFVNNLCRGLDTPPSPHLFQHKIHTMSTVH